MQPQATFTLPADPPKREFILSVRLTPLERAAIHAFAKKVNVSVSKMVRHFVLQGIHKHDR